MSFEYKTCPRCGAISFYVDTPDGSVIFKVFTNGELKLPRFQELHEEPDIIHCTQCSWEGKIEDLLEEK